MEKKLQIFGINMGQRYKIFRKKKKIRRNIMKLENKYKSTRNKIMISLYNVKHEEKKHRPGLETAPIHKYSRTLAVTLSELHDSILLL